MVGAMWKVTVLVTMFMFSPGGNGLFHSIYKKARVSVPRKGDVGKPLFLTSYIEAGKLAEGKRKSLVPPFPGLNVKSYAGYLTVNKTYNSNLFFWFFPAQVGTGFSFTDDPQGYAVNEDDVARNLYSALVQFFLLFPEYKNNDFYATGESYAGKYVPALAHYIHVLNPVMKMKINLKGIALGDAYSDPESIIGGYATFLYHIGLLDEKQRKYFQKQCDECVKYIKEKRWLQAFEVLDKLLDGDLTSNPSYFQNITGCPSYYNILQCKEPEDQNYYGKFLSLPEVRQAIHVGNRTFSDGSEVEKYMREDTVKSVKLWLAELMNNYKVLIYNGQLDIIVAASLTERSLMAMKWKGSQKYKQAERKVWKILKSDNEVAGYVRQVDDFSQVIVRGGGHILPYDQPLRTFDMINRFIFNRGWDPY
ncbi:probable serine carboxypeptidase CPVL isoform X4 [Neovison vison]|uniref:probable serine carboxypeptidase CPVL isoform X4 n=1 Tax=Neovison vison TaxID=452646 RepID=UPI001CF028B9|nr:probable serine carboxypeptidase CPVL isoform X4 [Neogale vison]